MNPATAVDTSSWFDDKPANGNPEHAAAEPAAGTSAAVSWHFLGAGGHGVIAGHFWDAFRRAQENAWQNQIKKLLDFWQVFFRFLRMTHFFFECL